MAEGKGIPAVGDIAPDFSLPSSTGETIGLHELAGRKVVLYFYPKADTPGCTVEACGFRDMLSEYDRAKIAVLGISPDPIEDVNNFAEKLGLNFPLLADGDHAIAEKYGVWQEKRMMGRAYMGVVRTTFVIDVDGRIERVFEKVKPDGHEKEVLKTLS